MLRLFVRVADQARRRNVRLTEGRQGRKIDLLWRSRMVLLRRFERLTDTQQQRLLMRSTARTTTGGRRRLPRLPRSPRRVQPHQHRGLRSTLGELFRGLARRDVTELLTLGRTLDRWLSGIIAYFERAPPTRAPKVATARSNRSSVSLRRPESRQLHAIGGG